MRKGSPVSGMGDEAMAAMAERLASGPVRAFSSPDLLALLASCEDRLGLMSHYVCIGELPEKALRAMSEKMEASVRAACLGLRQTLSEMDFVLSSVGMGQSSVLAAQQGVEGEVTRG